jgi:hypothetical protein
MSEYWQSVEFLRNKEYKIGIAYDFNKRHEKIYIIDIYMLGDKDIARDRKITHLVDDVDYQLLEDKLNEELLEEFLYEDLEYRKAENIDPGI